MEKNISISFFILAHGRLNATNFTLSTVRKYYPDSKIIMFENETNILEDVAKSYKVEYHNQPINFMKPDPMYVYFSSRSDIYLFLSQIKYICENLDTKWIMYLEPDVVIRNPIEKMPKDSYGAGGGIHSFNTFNQIICKKINDMRIRYGQSDSKIMLSYTYACAGGNVLNREKLLNILIDANKIDPLIDWILSQNKNNVKDLYANDGLISFILLCFGHDIYDWDQYVEIEHSTNQYRNIFAPVVHKFKHFY